MEITLAAFLKLLNETLASAIVVIAASMLLYNLTRNLNDRVARTSSVVLGCVTITYICDVFLSLGPGPATYSATLRLQWLGIAFMPVGLLHLSDALLATTGLPSRGRRRRAIRVLYIISAVFVLLAAFTDLLIQPVPIRPPLFETGAYFSVQGGPLFPIYVAYFIVATVTAFINVQRARDRCLTRSTRRRMGYLQIAMLTPSVGIFPFSILLGPGEEYSLLGLAMVILANVVVILMLLFLAYPLSFFGSRVPDRVVKTELLRFMLRGPATGLLALVTILYTTPATRILGLSGQAFMPFAVVAVVLFWQWVVALSLPYLERWLVYGGEDYEHLQKLQTLGERLLSRSDLIQLLEATLNSVCDYLRVNTAFVALLKSDEPELVAAVGPIRPTTAALKEEAEHLMELLHADHRGGLAVVPWQSFWITPLYSSRTGESAPPIGFLAMQARSNTLDLKEDEREMLSKFARRAANTLDDMLLQTEIFAALEGLLPQIAITRSSAERIEYRPRRPATASQQEAQLPAPSEQYDPEQFKEQVRAALRHYWGGPGLTSSRLLELSLVQVALAEHDNNPGRALRAVLQRAIEGLRPEGERKFSSPEWTLYNILELRFIKGTKVKEVANRLSLSEADLYRKQNTAIAEVAARLLEMEQAIHQARAAQSGEAHPPAPSQPRLESTPTTASR